MNEISPDTVWYQTDLDRFLNRWFANYEDARSAREAEGGFLLPYKHHFFVCRPDVIRALGLEPDDPDWEKIAWDCARPRDIEAFQRLRQKREQVIENRAP